MYKSASASKQKQTCFPHLDYLSKHQVYKIKLDQKQNALKEDVNSIIATLAKQPSICHQKLKHLNTKYFQSKINFKISSKPEKRFSHCLAPEDVKNIRMEVIKYMQKLQLPQTAEKKDYNQFARLSIESEDYLQFYLKHHSKTTGGNDILREQQKTVILSQLKNHYRCLTQNCPEIANRILLSFQINPLNDFHFIPWSQFIRFRKMATHHFTKSQFKTFLVDFFVPKIKKKSTKQEFWVILGAIICKLEKVINRRNVQKLIQRLEKACSDIVPQQVTRKQLQRIITNQPLFLWQQLAKLIFLI